MNRCKTFAATSPASPSFSTRRCRAASLCAAMLVSSLIVAGQFALARATCSRTRCRGSGHAHTRAFKSIASPSVTAIRRWPQRR